LINLVSGGAGLIGSYIIDSLLSKDNEVICIDNFYTGNKNNISKWLNDKRFQLIEQDIIKPIDLKVNRIWHFACPASPHKYKIDPIKTSQINFIGTYNMLELAKKNNARILFASSSEIYGNPKVHPQNESYYGYVNPISERSCYVEGKRISESLCLDYFRRYKTEIRIARIFNTYGPRMMPKDGRVISNFISQAINGEPLYIYGSGKQTRSFCYIEDLIIGLNKIMNSDYTLPINLGSQEELSIIDLANLIRKKINKRIKIIHTKESKEDPMNRRPDIKLARKVINWESKTKINEGLDITIKEFLKN
tara:strand:+ start:829 stop:1749 length:921 start_codon:yes stop_codon:yes gene_type:complete